jgi:hypothetical protein
LTNADEPLNDAVGSNAVVQSGGGAAGFNRGGGGAGAIVTERLGSGLTNADEPLNDAVGSNAIVQSGGRAAGSNRGGGGAGGASGTGELGGGLTNKALIDAFDFDAVVRPGGRAAGSNRGGGGAGAIVTERLGGVLTNADEPLNFAVGSNAVMKSGGGGGSTKGTGCDGANVNSFVADPNADFLSPLNQCPRNAMATMITMQAEKTARNFECFCSSFASNVPLNEAAVARPSWSESLPLDAKANASGKIPEPAKAMCTCDGCDGLPGGGAFSSDCDA